MNKQISCPNPECGSFYITYTEHEYYECNTCGKTWILKNITEYSKTCSTCKHWRNHDAIQDIYPDTSFTIPIDWKLCTNEASYSLTNMFLKDKKFEEFIAEKEIEYYGLDENGKFTKNIEYLHHRSELFGCKFHEDETL